MAGLDNDTRGWIMCTVSGIACVLGASIICVDVLVRMIPSERTRNFRIQDSNVFLASSLSLSFGVMLFSALYTMLPNSKTYLIKSGFTPSNAAWILLACFTGGFVGIQILSRALHKYIPSHVVDCDHQHADDDDHDHIRKISNGGRGRHRLDSHHSRANGKTSEATPLLPPSEPARSKSKFKSKSKRKGGSPDAQVPSFGADGASHSRRHADTTDRRPSMIEVQKRVLSFVKDVKNDCDSTGPCFGYSDPCGLECYKNISSRTGSRTGTIRSTSAIFAHSPSDCPVPSPNGITRAPSVARESSPHLPEHVDLACDSDDGEDPEAQHHHHVPENAFMSIGLLTPIAIALHKLPEGFITYATNHANPTLGFSVFMALFIHSITEGFAMALPLFLALGSRFRAIFWASILGGISQPLGAGVAAAWFKIAGEGGHKPGQEVYGCMFGITSGIMASVALQLFVESLALTHDRNLCILFAFLGMMIMGVGNALTS